MGRLRTYILAALTSFAFACAAATACDCVGEPAPKVLFASADVVFVGRVTNVELPGRWLTTTSTPPSGCGFTAKWEGLDIFYCESENAIVTLEVERSWKGDVKEQLKVFTPPQVAACGVRFLVGSEYIVYANLRASDGVLTTESCDGTRHVSEARADIAVL